MQLIHPWAIFTESIKNWRLNWRKLSWAYLLIYVPVTLVTILLPARKAQPSLSGFLLSITQWLIDSFAITSLIILAGDLSAEVAAAYKSALKCIWRYLLTVVLYGLAIAAAVFLGIMSLSFAMGLLIKSTAISPALVIAILGVILCVAAAVYLGIRFSLAGLIAVLEKASPFAAIMASHRLISRHATAVVAEYTLVIFLLFLLFIPVTVFTPALLRFPAGAAVIEIYQLLISSIVVPLWSLVFVKLYHKLKEAAG